MTIVTGKMVKISPYHFDGAKDNNTFLIFAMTNTNKLNLLAMFQIKQKV
jgi:hypothetical protein